MNTTVPIEREPDWARAADPSPVRAPGAPGAPGERHLRLAEPAPAAAKRAGRSPLVGALLAVGVILAILATQLGLSIAISQGAYEARALEVEQRDLSRVERVLSQNVDKLSSPQNLAENAAQLGMVQNVRPAALRLSDGAVLGSLETETTAAQGNLVPNATLETMPVVDAAGLLVSRDAPAAGSQDASTEAPVRWKGKLPAPATH
ncbi:hypothetical protein MUN78_05785 [Leucobacter allii]|uniref:Cell division protein FtsL n=1 Tax=Leucobacter allii TaxID=2932247 RepID=A0ABY4FQ18_9MICO|nr:hypothetical protein [Leucobacter allii]UOQ58347.1 hypothetical protein MUN78_05785 [Leucobacter allii]UOR02926.1 hypothetical protein MUN77_06395 [Leucobacter allii]